jgi:hypothetical protein
MHIHECTDTLTELSGKVISDAKVSGKLLDSRTYLALVTFVGILCESGKYEPVDRRLTSLTIDIIHVPADIQRKSKMAMW